jgi:single-stranded DNA-binding protein
MINFTLTGRVAQPPEAKGKIWIFSVAVNEFVPGETNGEKNERTTFCRIKCFKEPKVTVGSIVEVRGRLEVDKRPEGGYYEPAYVADRVQIHTWGRNERGEDAGRKVKGAPPSEDLPF